jgi:hypothetical protein
MGHYDIKHFIFCWVEELAVRGLIQAVIIKTIVRLLTIKRQPKKCIILVSLPGIEFAFAFFEWAKVAQPTGSVHCALKPTRINFPSSDVME